MYKYTRMIKDGKVDFLEKYKFNGEYDFKYYDTKELDGWSSLLKKYTIDNRSEICGPIDFVTDINTNRLSLVKLLLVEYDYFCYLYLEGKIDNTVLAQSVGSRLNYLLYLYNIIRLEGLDYLDDGDRARVDTAFNYLFSNLYAITIINHDKDNKYRKMILSGNNNYEDICFVSAVDMDSVNFEKEFNTFVNDFRLNRCLEFRKVYKKKRRKEILWD